MVTDLEEQRNLELKRLERESVGSIQFPPQIPRKAGTLGVLESSENAV